METKLFEVSSGLGLAVVSSLPSSSEKGSVQVQVRFCHLIELKETILEL